MLDGTALLENKNKLLLVIKCLISVISRMLRCYQATSSEIVFSPRVCSKVTNRLNTAP